jgi:uncharacterized phage protein (TIGR02220 family)
MPNRILRDGILSSRRVDRLSEPGELFYRRLMSRLDDYGRCEADVDLIRSSCYPLRVDRVKPPQIEAWLRECQAACLLVTYAVNGKAYLQYLDWRQQVRAESKYPAPAEQLISDAQHLIANEHLVVGGGVVVVEGDFMSGCSPDPVSHDVKKANGHAYRGTAKRVIAFLNEKTGSVFKPGEANVEPIVARLKEGATETELRQVVVRKCREWKGDEKMARYLRPKTLFNRTNFANYQGELVANDSRAEPLS